MRDFSELREQEILALAISLEEEDERTYDDYAHSLEAHDSVTAAVLSAMAKQEAGHRNRLIDLYRSKFGEYIPMIRRTDVRGFMKRPSVWLRRPLGLDNIRKHVESIEMESLRFYRNAARQTKDASLRELFDDLAAERHGRDIETPKVEPANQRKLFVLQIVQPGLAGLMDGSVSTLAPIFAAAFATHQSHDAFLVGLAASLGAGISMAFAEAASDDGSLTGRGSPVLRGIVTGAMTTVGGLGHTMPFLISEFHTALVVAVIVVAIELAAISWIRNRYMDTPLLRAAFQVVVGGVLVFITGILIGGSG